jgi:hypothetical protein
MGASLLLAGQLFEGARVGKLGGAHRVYCCKMPARAAEDNPVDSLDSHSSRPGRADGGLDAPIKEKMETAFGADLSSVRVHEDGEAAKMGAQAFTRGSDLHFAPGQYQPDTARGQELIGHELAHVVQQSEGRVAASFQAKGLAVNDDPGLEAEADAIGARAARGERVADLGGADVGAGFSSIAQCYLDQKIAKKDWRVADDLSIAIRQDTSKPAYGSHNFFAEASLIKSSSAILKAQTSRLELTAAAETMSVTDGKSTKTLHRVEPKNNRDGTSGNDKGATGMQWPDDCGYAANAVMQGNTKTKAVYSDADTEKKAAAAEAMTNVAVGAVAGPAMGAVAGKGAAAVSTAASQHEGSTLDYNSDETQYRGNTLYTPHMMLDEILSATLDPDPVKAWAKYQAMKPDEREDFDRNVGINKYASPETGEALSIVSNKDEYVDGKSAWNFHWGGVAMKSGGDFVTMENFAGSGGDAWDFQMYGSAKKAGQTFHEQQEERTAQNGQDEYGPNPTTIRVRPG